MKTYGRNIGILGCPAALLALGLALLGQPPALAAPLAAPSASAEAQLAPPAEPTDVGVGLYLVGLTKISDAREPFPYIVAELFLDAKWHDRRLAFDPAQVGVGRRVLQGEQVTRALEQIWWPDLVFENEEGPRTVENRELIVLPDGAVEYQERLQVRLHSEVDLRRFPFDSQVFEAVVASFAWSDQHVRFTTLDHVIGHDADHHTLEWHLDGTDAHVRSRREVRSPHPFSELVFRIHVTRDPGFYLWKLVVPLMIIASLSWTSFWMTGEPAPTRMQRAFIALLSVVAFHRVVADSLPRISYLTFMDGIVYLVFLLSGLTMVAIVATHNLLRVGDTARAERLDRIGRYGFPMAAAAGFGGLWTLAHL